MNTLFIYQYEKDGEEYVVISEENIDPEENRRPGWEFRRMIPCETKSSDYNLLPMYYELYKR